MSKSSLQTNLEYTFARAFLSILGAPTLVAVYLGGGSFIRLPFADSVSYGLLNLEMLYGFGSGKERLLRGF